MLLDNSICEEMIITNCFMFKGFLLFHRDKVVMDGSAQFVFSKFKVALLTCYVSCDHIIPFVFNRSNNVPFIKKVAAFVVCMKGAVLLEKEIVHYLPPLNKFQVYIAKAAPPTKYFGPAATTTVTSKKDVQGVGVTVLFADVTYEIENRMIPATILHLTFGCLPLCDG